MSLLAVDIANSHVVLGLLEGPGADAEVLADWRVSTDERRTADEWAVLLRGLLLERLDEVDAVAVSATVPAVLSAWREMLARHLPDVAAVVVEPGVRTGIPVRTDNPREVGSDRVVNALAALTRYGAPAVVVDFGGTATTFDVVDAGGRYVGGAISPGIEISLDALARRGAQLRRVELARPRSVIARNTVEAIQSGLVFGVASQVEGLVARIVAELSELPGQPDGVVPEVQVIATGPFADLVVAECRCFTDHDPWLTLRGLGEIFRRNS